MRGKDPNARVAARQETSVAIVADLFKLWQDALARISGKSKLAEAIRYAISRRATLERFLTDGRVEINSNIVERAIRPHILKDARIEVERCAPIREHIGPFAADWVSYSIASESIAGCQHDRPVMAEPHNGETDCLVLIINNVIEIAFGARFDNRSGCLSKAPLIARLSVPVRRHARNQHTSIIFYL